MRYTSLFQFHKGTIRTFRYDIYCAFRAVFQFHKGTIRTFRLCHNINRLKFQFHKGTIRTYKEDEEERKFTNFNSIKVRLEH